MSSTFHHVCNMCHFQSNDFRRFKSHVLRMHRNSPDFLVSCSYGPCAYSTKSWNAFKMHVYRYHSEINLVRDGDQQLTAEFASDDLRDSDGLLESDGISSNIHNITEIKNAEFALKLETVHKIPKVAIDNIIQHTSHLLSHHVSEAVNNIKTHLEPKMSHEDLSFMNSFVKGIKLTNVESEYSRRKYYSNHCSLVEPQEVLLGTELRNIKGHMTDVKRYGYCIPLQKALQALLNLPEVLTAVSTSHYSESSMMKDICDGMYIRTHPLFLKDPNALAIVLNHDDMEIVNPLGSRIKKNKLSMFYFYLANIQPQFRSKLVAIQLVAIARSRDLRKYGVDKLLEDFVTTVNELQCRGIKFKIGTSERLVYGTLVMAPCDTLAAQWIGGFKEGVGFAVKPCRTCEVTQTEAKRTFFPEWNERNLETHMERLENLESVSKKSKTYWSKMWGINARSALCNIEGFPLNKCLVHDPMHILSEGIIPYEAALMLYEFIYVKKYVTLTYMNNQIDIFPYSYLDKSNKPEHIEQKDILGKKLKQTSASIMTLCYIMPFLIGDKVKEDDEMWKNFVRLVQITILATSPYADLDTVGQIDQLGSSHHYKFQEIYPTETIKPKFHYCLHFGNQIKQFGPGRNQWCLRFEGKHGFFKQKKWHNFKNIPKSMAEFHQKYMCYRMLTCSSVFENDKDNFLYSGDTVKDGSVIDIEKDLSGLKEQCFTLFLKHHLTIAYPLAGYTSPAVSIHGHTYKPGIAMQLNCVEGVPTFGLLHQNLIYDSMKFFIFENLVTLGFDRHFNAYVLKTTGNYVVESFLDIENKWPLSVYYVKREMYVTNRYSHFVEHV